jgi:hypothetical protein
MPGNADEECAAGPQLRAEPGRAVLTGAAAAPGGLWFGLVARIVTSWLDRSRTADQDGAGDLHGCDGPAPSVTLRSVPTRR